MAMSHNRRRRYRGYFDDMLTESYMMLARAKGNRPDDTMMGLAEYHDRYNHGDCYCLECAMMNHLMGFNVPSDLEIYYGIAA